MLRTAAHDRLTNPRVRVGSPRGFTLVEMLVSVALVLLLMTLFAQVFQIAAGSVSTQRGLMENDQRARSVQTVLKGDLEKRTFRKLVPFMLNEQLDAPETEALDRRGYFSISENDPNDRTDDVLSFTVDARVTVDSDDATLFYGRALTLGSLRVNENQPDRDDGRLDTNNASDSPAAEVCYFLRNGNLYRRSLLLRQPDQGSVTEDQPTFTTAGGGQQRFFSMVAPVYPGAYGNASNFWRDFDFSAHSSQRLDGTGPVWLFNGAIFNGVNSLVVTRTVPNVVADEVPNAISYPPNRFGHNYVDMNPVLAGNPPAGGFLKEYTQPGVDGVFLGRFTQQETSDDQFQYPHQDHLNVNCPVSNNLDFVNGELVLESDPTVNFNDNFTRRGEDLLLTNVHSFDIKVYDEILGRFVDLGHGITSNGRLGDFHFNQRMNGGIYGGNGPVANHVFDTWYPFNNSLPEDLNDNGILDGTEDSVPPGNNNGILDFRQSLDLDLSGGIGNEDTDDDGQLQPGEDTNGNALWDHENHPPYRPLVVWPRSASSAGDPNTGAPRRWLPLIAGSDRWQRNTEYQVGDRVFPPLGSQPGDPFFYVCIAAIDGGGIAGDPVVSESNAAVPTPSFPRQDGLSAIHVNSTNGDRLEWRAVDNRKPLRAIQIELRFVDPTTTQMRTLTIQHGLVD